MSNLNLFFIVFEGGIGMEKVETFNEKELEEKMYNEIKELIENSKRKAYIAVNTILLDLYWHIGENIVNNFQKGEKRAKYGEHILKNLSIRFTLEYGKGYSLTNMKNMRKFYLYYQKGQSLPDQLSWSHYTELLKVKEEPIRNFYMQECINSRWSYRELERMIKSHLYERLLVSNEDNNLLPVQGNVINTSKDLIKDPYVLEFLNLESYYQEKDLENEILAHLKEFLLELGKGFTYVGSEVKISINNKNYYPDLVFYNHILKCFVILELKIGVITHKDIGQINMYVNYYDEKVRQDDDKPTIGILLGKEKNKAVIKFALPKNSEIYASSYLLHLPSKEELEREIEKY